MNNMNVANLELCKELYEVSGWSGSEFYFNGAGQRFYLKPIRRQEPLATYETPAYDLGYLLRKVPHREPGNERFILTLSPEWSIRYEQLTIEGYVDFGEVHFLHEADTPEDAACKLAIELFNQGVLTKKPR